jgi:hypothetical protein
MQGHAREELSEPWARKTIAHYEDATALFARHGGEFRSAKTMCAEIARSTRRGLAAALNNGLNEKENRELMHCTDAQRIAQLVLQGLRRL